MANLIVSPAKRWLAAIVIPAFLAIQLFNSALQSFLPQQFRSGHGFNLPWQMFSSPLPFAFSLAAVGITAKGERIDIPVHDEIFTHMRGLMHVTAFEEAAWLMTPAPEGDMERKRELAFFFRDRMAAWGIEVVQVQLRLKLVTDKTGRVRYVDLGTFDTPPPDPPRRPPQ